MGYGTCRKCGAQILWVTTTKGKSMPCDPHIFPYWANPEGKEIVVTTTGETVRADITGDYSQATGMGYKSHFATCPYRK